MLGGCASTNAASSANANPAQPDESVEPPQQSVALFDAGSRTFAHAHPSVLTWNPGTAEAGGELHFYFAAQPGEQLRPVSTCRAEGRRELAGPVECRGYTERKISVRPLEPGRVEVVLQGEGWAPKSPTTLVLQQTSSVQAVFDHFKPPPGNSNPESRHLEPLGRPYMKELERKGRADRERVERELRALGWDPMGFPLATALSIQGAVAEKPTYLLAAAREDREPLLQSFIREAIDYRIHDLVVSLPPLRTDLPPEAPAASGGLGFETLQEGGGEIP